MGFKYLAFLGISRINQGFPLSIKTDAVFSLVFTWSTEGFPCFLRTSGPLLQKHAIAMLLAWPQEALNNGPTTILQNFSVSNLHVRVYVKTAPISES